MIAIESIHGVVISQPLSAPNGKVLESCKPLDGAK